MAKTRKPLADRFWAKVEKRGPDECWPWLAVKVKNGYGLLREQGKSSKTLAHRISYTLNIGTIPSGQNVLHHCDNPSCVNPRHLFSGTHQDNVDDKVAKGRQRGGKGGNVRLKGEANPYSKITDDIVRDIRRRRAAGETGVSVAQLYGVTPATVADVWTGKTWRHLLDKPVVVLAQQAKDNGMPLRCVELSQSSLSHETKPSIKTDGRSVIARNDRRNSAAAKLNEGEV